MHINKLKIDQKVFFIRKNIIFTFSGLKIYLLNAISFLASCDEINNARNGHYQGIDEQNSVKKSKQHKALKLIY